MLLDKIETTCLSVDPFHTDFRKQLSLETLGVDLLNAAENHATHRGFGMHEANHTNYTWVLSRLAIELFTTPLVYDDYSISTWIESVYRLFTNRNFLIAGKDGKVFGYAKSVWATINYDTREPVDLHTMYGTGLDDYLLPDADCPISALTRVKPIPDEFIHSEMTVGYSDLDMNGHLNSMKYILHIKDLFPLDMYKSHRIRRMELSYMAEAYYGETLTFYVRSSDEMTHDIEIRRKKHDEMDKNNIVLRAKVFFE